MHKPNMQACPPKQATAGRLPGKSLTVQAVGDFGDFQATALRTEAQLPQRSQHEKHLAGQPSTKAVTPGCHWHLSIIQSGPGQS